MTDPYPDTFTALTMKKETPPLNRGNSINDHLPFLPPLAFTMSYVAVIIVVVLSPIFITLLLISIALIIFFY
jgi:hypothetical protein